MWELGGIGQDTGASKLTVAHGAGQEESPLLSVIKRGKARDDGRNFEQTGIPATQIEGSAFAHAQYGGADAAPTSLSRLLDIGDSVRTHLSLTEEDVICVPVNMNHTMGFGFGVVPAILAGASVVLPSTTTSVETTLAAMKNQACTILIADSHVTKVLQADKVTRSHAPSLRGGLVKVGSGETISDGQSAVGLFDGTVTLSAVGTPR